jgi:hypothetical protein
VTQSEVVTLAQKNLELAKEFGYTAPVRSVVGTTETGPQVRIQIIYLFFIPVMVIWNDAFSPGSQNCTPGPEQISQAGKFLSRWEEKNLFWKRV